MSDPRADSVARAGMPNLSSGANPLRAEGRALLRPTATDHPTSCSAGSSKMTKTAKYNRPTALSEVEGFIRNEGRRLTAGQTGHFRTRSSPIPGRRFHISCRFHAAPSSKTAHSESATTVTPPRKNSFGKQTHPKVPLQRLNLTQTTIVQSRPPSRRRYRSSQQTHAKSYAARSDVATHAREPSSCVTTMVCSLAASRAKSRQEPQSSLKRWFRPAVTGAMFYSHRCPRRAPLEESAGRATGRETSFQRVAHLLLSDGTTLRKSLPRRVAAPIRQGNALCGVWYVEHRGPKKTSKLRARSRQRHR